MGSSESHFPLFNNFNIMASFVQIFFTIYRTKAALLFSWSFTIHMTEALFVKAEIFAIIFNVFNLQSRQWQEQSRRLPDPIYDWCQAVGMWFFVTLGRDQTFIFEWGDIRCPCVLFFLHGSLHKFRLLQGDFIPAFNLICPILKNAV